MFISRDIPIVRSRKVNLRRNLVSKVRSRSISTITPLEPDDNVPINMALSKVISVPKASAPTPISPTLASNISVTGSDSTLPTDFLNLEGMRIWSWPLGDESVHSNVLKITRGSRVCIHYYSKASLNGDIRLTLFNVQDDSISSYLLKFNSPSPGKLFSVSHPVDLGDGYYVVSVKSKEKIFIVNMSSES